MAVAPRAMAKPRIATATRLPINPASGNSRPAPISSAPSKAV